MNKNGSINTTEKIIYIFLRINGNLKIYEIITNT